MKPLYNRAMSELIDTVINGDCLEVMNKISDNSIDLIFCDLPYGVSKNKWDSIIDLPTLWVEYWRVLKDNGAIVLTATQPFTSMLVSSQYEHFKFEWIWEKTVGSQQFNIKTQPLKVHESVLVFYKKSPTYNEQLLPGKPYSINRKARKGSGYGDQTDSKKVNAGFRHARSVLKISNPRVKGGHPTGKPVELVEHFIKIYSDRGDLVLDNCLGGGSTLIACQNTGRHFIGIEKDIEYCKIARKALK